MEKLNELIEKYFRGETSIPEEIELKKYFKSSVVSPEHEMYRPLFLAFEDELQVKPINPLSKAFSEQKKAKRIWIKTFAYTGIAATLLLALWIQRPQESSNYAMVSGERIQNNEFAEKYATEKLNKVNEILHRSMKPMESIDKVSDELKPVHKLTEMKNRINALENKLQLK